MLSNNKYKQIYRNLFDDFSKEFLIPSYREANISLRASGFFTLDSLVLTSDGILELIKKGGHLKLICSPLLTESDVERIKNGVSLSQEDVVTRLLDVTNSNGDVEELNKLKLDLFCNLIASNIIELKIAFMPQGIYHEKFGIFLDDSGNGVYFNGSFNSTKSGSLDNTESFAVMTSWDGFSKTINQERKYFDDIWNDRLEKIRTLSFPDVVKNSLFEHYKQTDSVDESVFRLVTKLAGKKVKELWPFQEQAINEFVQNGFSHFYEMATGTGKTFTTIRTIKRVTKLKEKCFAMILVPQIDLQNQWKNSLLDDGFENVYLLGGCNGALRSEQDFNEAVIHNNLDQETVVCVALYDTYFDKFYSRVNNIDGLFIIVDEAHNLTPNYFQKLPTNPAYKLGLSATIERWSKTETNNIKNYFTEGRPTFYYGIKDAIDAGFLAPYEYHPLFVHLYDEDFNRFKAKTKALAQKLNDDEPDDDEIQRLRNERSLIIKKASCKLDFLSELVDSDYDFKNSVVYCGMGKDNEDSIIDSVTKILSEDDKYIVSQYTSKTENRIQVLYEFENGYFDTLIAIKCFDEGVDVPKLDKIYIMASDASKRQTVQRRGRVLRQCKETNKTIAYIYDMVVLPPLGVVDGPGVMALLTNEFIRVSEYASLCENQQVLTEINDVLSEYNCRMEDLVNGEVEYD